MFSTLSVELLQEIGSELAKSDQKRLRAVCKDIGLAINPLFYSNVVLNGYKPRQEIRLHFLKALASRETGWSHYAKSLRIVTASPTRIYGQKPATEEPAERMDISDDAMEDLMVSALGALTKIRTAVWTMRRDEPAWRHNAILPFLATSALLTDLEFFVSDTTDVLLPPICRLRKLKITSPRWTKSSFVEQQVSHLVESNRRLTSLELFGHAPSQVWTTLRGGPDRHLKEIRAPHSQALVTYIDSYSGIERLEVNYPDGGDWSVFFHKVLPRHAATLLELSCSAGYECNWSFRSDTVDPLLKLKMLTHLKVSINKEDIPEPLNVVHLLLRTVAALPALADLNICAATAQRHRNARCGNPILAHKRTVHEAIAAAVQNFRGSCASRAVVTVGSFNRFELKPLDEEAQKEVVWGYHLIPHPNLGSKLVFWG